MHDRPRKTHQSIKGQQRREFILSLRAEPDCRDPIKSLRWILKSALQAHRMRCTGIMEASADEGHSKAPPISPEAPLAPSQSVTEEEAQPLRKEHTNAR
jgi:hypothetical protein